MRESGCSSDSVNRALCQDIATFAKCKQTSFETSPWNMPFVLAICIDALRSSTTTRTTSGTAATLSEHFINILRSFSWHRSVMRAAADLLADMTYVGFRDMSSQGTQIDLVVDRVYFTSLDAAYVFLLPNVLSHDPELRLASLQVLLRLGILDKDKSEECREVCECLRQCITTELVKLSFQTARERCQGVRRLATIVKAHADQRSIQIAVQYLMGQCCVLLGHSVSLLNYGCLTASLKIGFKPLWSEAIAALSDLASSAPDVVWKAVSEQLLFSFRHQPSPIPIWHESPESASKVTSNGFHESDFQCSELSRRRVAVHECYTSLKTISATPKLHYLAHVRINRLALRKRTYICDM